MELLLRRIAKKSTYTIGKLYQIKDGKEHYICDTLEDKDRGLMDSMSVKDILSFKVYGETAIPSGKYNLTMNVKSNRFSNFSKYPFYKKWEGYLPRLLNVKGFDGILIHCGQRAENSHGCVLVGKNSIVGGLTQSREYFIKLMDEYLIPAKKRGEKITIEIK